VGERDVGAASGPQPSHPGRSPAVHLPALDGVRGFAILLVLLFHLRITGFAAGFLGVDVFFVLSGFLITGLLIAEARNSSRISLPRFWARRARRLLPALVLLLLVVAVVEGLNASPPLCTRLTGTSSPRAAISTTRA
jgi:peptidoglycan/LPS O-acetylase OafA/YrhL